jgi:serine/threonine protein kinase
MAADNGVPKALQALMKRGAARRTAAPLGVVGRYELLELVGEGGHGRVYRARDRESSAIVAIKVLHDDVNNPELELRMKREAYAMGKLAGTCATEVYECAETEAGKLYLAMEFLDGQDLESLIEAQEATGTLLPIPAMFELLGPVVQTLEVAHSRGVIHRDLKPQNIFVRTDGQVRLVDFGLMKDLHLSKLTEAGMVAGSPAYIAPEAWAGVPERLDSRIDVYALGVLAFRILSGRKPFEPEGGLLDFVLVVTTAPRPSLRTWRPDFPPAIDAWSQWALAIQPEHRFPTVTALWDGLKRALGG